MKIRKADLKDLEEIRKLNQELFKYDYDNFDKDINVKWSFGKEHEECYKKDISGKDSAIFLALVDEKIVGYILCKIIDAEIYSTSKRIAFLEDMFVVEKYRGLNIGTRLINEFIKWEKSKGMKKATITVSIKNKKAIKFYKKNKFKEKDIILEKKLK